MTRAVRDDSRRSGVWRAGAVAAFVAATVVSGSMVSVAHAEEPPPPPSTLPAETGEIDGAIVAVGAPPVPPGDEVIVAVGQPPVPPTSVVVAVGLAPVPPAKIASAPAHPESVVVGEVETDITGLLIAGVGATFGSGLRLEPCGD